MVLYQEKPSPGKNLIQGPKSVKHMIILWLLYFMFVKVLVV